MTWADDICETVAVDPHLVLTGRTDDLVYVDHSDQPGAQPAVRRLRDLAFETGSHWVAVVDPTFGIRVDVVGEESTPPAAEQVEVERVRGCLPAELRNRPGTTAPLAPDGPRPSLEELTALVGALAQVEYRGTVIVSDGGRWIVNVRSLEVDEHQLFTTCSSVARASELRPGNGGAPGYNALWWLCRSDAELPSWYVADPCVRLVAVGGPTRGQRGKLGAALLGVPPGSSGAQEFADETDGMYVRSLPQVATMVVSGRKVHEAATLVRLGVTDDPWTDPELLERVRTGREQLGARVVGQDPVLDQAWSGLTRSLTGLNGAHRPSSGRRPRLVLFLAGPTGVGKTELAKAIAKLIFGDDDAVLRFDMSGYREPHTAQGLIGSPPGYVGHEAGGTLTNQVRERPFSVILFDEIEKADGRILDTFLQVLDEGHLDDGRGIRTYFDQSVIIFTSNLGIVDSRGTVLVDDSMEPEQVRAHVARYIREYFTNTLGRPELLGRFGDAFAVFDFIRPEVAERIFDLMIRNMVNEIENRQGLRLEFAPAAEDALRSHCCADLSTGGRGIGNAIESAILNPLGSWEFDQMLSGEQLAGRSATVTAWSQTDGVPELLVEFR